MPADASFEAFPKGSADDRAAMERIYLGQAGGARQMPAYH
jgi:hypothetical protein